VVSEVAEAAAVLTETETATTVAGRPTTSFVFTH